MSKKHLVICDYCGEEIPRSVLVYVEMSVPHPMGKAGVRLALDFCNLGHAKAWIEEPARRA